MEINPILETHKEELAFDDLDYYVIKKGLCTGCGTCAGICSHIEFEDNLPSINKIYDPYCSSCIQFCPQFYTPFSKIEKTVFGTTRVDRNLGYYDHIVSARSTSDSILNVCQDGGVVSTISKYLLEAGIVDGIVMSGISKEEPLKPVPIVATMEKHVIDAAGSRYCVCPVVMGLREAFEKDIRKIAIVGTACQVQGIRKVELFSEDHYPFDIKAVIGIFCYENFLYDDLFKNFIEAELGIELRDVKAVKIRHNAFELHRTHEINSIPLKTVYKHVNGACTVCRDFTAELSDISVGAIGSGTGWNTVIVRSKRGKSLFEEVIDNNLLLLSDKVDIDNLTRMARYKKAHVEKISTEAAKFLRKLGASEFEVQVYGLLLSLNAPRLETINEILHVSSDEIEQALETLIERGWATKVTEPYTVSHIYLPEKPEIIINNGMKKLNNDLKQLKRAVLSELTSLYMRRISGIDILKEEA